MTIVNPYVAGPTVGNTEAFVGRNGILEHVLRNIDRRDVTLIHGQRRIGKTSILIELEARLPAPYIGVYFDANTANSTSQDDLVAALVRRICRRCKEPAPNLGQGVAEAFRDEWFPAFVARRPDVVLVPLIDEFDVAVDADEFMRYLDVFRNEHGSRLVHVFAIGRSIRDLRERATQFFKSASTVRVSLMERPEHDSIVRLASKTDPPSLEWTQDAVDAVWALTHGHAYLTQQLCLTIWERAHQSGGSTRIDAEAVAGARAAALDRSDATLQWLWGGLTPECKVTIVALAEAERGHLGSDDLMKRLATIGVELNAEVRAAPSHLKDWDILEAVDGDAAVFAFRVEMFRQWIRQQRSLAMVWYDLDRNEPDADAAYTAARNSIDLGERESLCRKALLLNKNHTGARKLLAELLTEAERYEEAMQVLDEPVDFRPEVLVQQQRHEVFKWWLRSADSRAKDREEIYSRISEYELDPTTKQELANRYRTLADDAYAHDHLRRAHALYERAGEPILASRAIAEWRARLVTRILYVFVVTALGLGIAFGVSLSQLLQKNLQMDAVEADRITQQQAQETEYATLKQAHDQLESAKMTLESKYARAVPLDDLVTPVIDYLRPVFDIPVPDELLREELLAAMSRPPNVVTTEDLADFEIRQYLATGVWEAGDKPWSALKINVFSRKLGAPRAQVRFDSTASERGGSMADAPVSRCIAIGKQRTWPVKCDSSTQEDGSGLLRTTSCDSSYWLEGGQPGAGEATEIVCVSIYRLRRSRPFLEWGLVSGDWCRHSDRSVFVGVSAPTPTPVLLASFASNAMPRAFRRVFLINNEPTPLIPDDEATLQYKRYLDLFAMNLPDALFRHQLTDARKSIESGGPLSFFSSDDLLSLASASSSCPGAFPRTVEYHVLIRRPDGSAPGAP